MKRLMRIKLKRIIQVAFHPTKMGLTCLPLVGSSSSSSSVTFIGVCLCGVTLERSWKRHQPVELKMNDYKCRELYGVSAAVIVFISYWNASSYGEAQMTEANTIKAQLQRWELWRRSSEGRCLPICGRWSPLRASPLGSHRRLKDEERRGGL